MDLFLFANFFPYQKAEPFLVNEITFAKKFSSKVSVFTLYGDPEKTVAGVSGLALLSPVFISADNKNEILFKGLFNLAPFHVHLKELFTGGIIFSPMKLYWFFTSLFLTRAVLSSSSFKKLLSNINSSKQPVLYFYWGDNLAWIIPYIKKKIPSNTRIVLRLHGSDLYENIKDNYAPLRNDVFSNSDLICTVSENGKNYLKKKYPLHASKISVARLGVFDNGLGPLPGQKPIIVSVSNLIPLKRVGLIFDALQLLDINLTWHHFGDGPLAAELKEQIKKRRKGLDIELHGFVSNKEIIEFYMTSYVDLFINASTSEGVPVSIMEALSFGIPVIATNVGGTSELVDDAVGKLVKADINELELSSELAHFLKLSKEEVALIREGARMRFIEKASAEKNYELFYKQLTS
ncbi:MAG: glycosyltransferase [Bacteroidia bacterium]